MGIYEVIRVKLLIDEIEPLREETKSLNFETKVIGCDLIFFNNGEKFNYFPIITVDPYKGVEVNEESIFGQRIKYIDKHGCEDFRELKSILDNKFEYVVEVAMVAV